MERLELAFGGRTCETHHIVVPQRSPRLWDRKKTKKLVRLVLNTEVVLKVTFHCTSANCLKVECEFWYFAY